MERTRRFKTGDIVSCRNNNEHILIIKHHFNDKTQDEEYEYILLYSETTNPYTVRGHVYSECANWIDDFCKLEA